MFARIGPSPAGHCIRYGTGGLVVGVLMVLVSVLDAKRSLNCSISQSEYNGLQALYDSCGGENWHWRTRLDSNTTIWTFPSSLDAPCKDSWEGITCREAGDSCQVTEVVLRGYQLVGALPSEIGDLFALQELYLDGNNMTSTIPSEIGRLTNLDELYLSYNEYTGHVPLELFQLNALSYLDLSYNQLVGRQSYLCTRLLNSALIILIYV
jgi:hypothetical protein